MATEDIDVEEDVMACAWVVAPTEACSFTSYAVFTEKRDAEAFIELLRKRYKRSGRYDDLAVVPGHATVLGANTYDGRAGRAALKSATRLALDETKETIT